MLSQFTLFLYGKDEWHVAVIVAALRIIRMAFCETGVLKERNFVTGRTFDRNEELWVNDPRGGYFTCGHGMILFERT